MWLARCTSHPVAWLFLRIHPGCIQASPTLNLVEDYVHFVITFFEIINTSAPHIYHSALLLSPQTSIIRKVHKNPTSPFARVVQGIPGSWERVIATADLSNDSYNVVWSPCNRFIAATESRCFEVFDAVTLSRLAILRCSSYPRSNNPLGFSADSRCLTLLLGEELVSWDLQTGGPLGTIPSRVDHTYATPFSLKHSSDGKVVAVAYKFQGSHRRHDKSSTFINTYNLLSGRCVGPIHTPEGEIIYPIWTHDEYLRFATIDPRPPSIRIWQSPFGSEQSPVEVVSFPAPDEIADVKRFLFLPALYRIAFVLGDTIQVWDLKLKAPPKLLLKSGPGLTLVGNPREHRFHDFPWGSFSSDGRLFAYAKSGGEVYVWKESPAGYLLHQRLPSKFSSPFLQTPPGPLLSPNGESIIILNWKIHRWHTRDQDLPLPSVSTKDSVTSHFALAFSPSENFAAFARQRGNMVTIIDLQSGELKWTTDMGVGIDCLGIAGDTVIVVGGDSIVAWNLPGGGRTFNASINDIVRTTIFDRSSPSHDLGLPYHMSVSPDLSRIVVARYPVETNGCSLEVDDVSTGLCLARITTEYLMSPWFTQDGREVWAGCDDPSEGWDQYEITEDSESGAIELTLQSAHRRRSGFFRESSRGYIVTGDGWVLSPSLERLLWLPHSWRSDVDNRVWGGRFLGFVHGELSEVVVLEFLE